jgi:hypothetical protein
MTVQAVKELGLSEDVEYLTGEVGTSKIVEMGIMSSPVLAVNDKPVMVGFTPDVEKIKKAITEGFKAKNSDKCECGGNCC